jgi:PAS domain S-box-containing protein
MNRTDLDYLQNLTILYVEDDEDIRGQLAQFLKRRCGNLVLAENGKKGLALFEQHKPDIIISDILMPEMDGLKMGEAIRELNPNVPIILTTAFEEPRYFHRAIDLGIDKYVTKPVDLSLLEGALVKCTRSIRAEKSLHQLQERTFELLEAQRIAKVGYWRLNFKSEEMSWSDEFLRIFEVEAANFVKSYADFVSLIHPEDRSLIEKIYQEHLAKNTEYDVEHRILLPDGNVKYVHELRTTERDTEGQPISTFGTIQDITERKLTELELAEYRANLKNLVSVRTIELEKAKNDAQSANRAKSVFLTNMSHELRTPLNAILGFAQLIERDPLLNEGHRNELQIINRAGRHLLALINDVLEISRIEAGQSVIQHETFDLKELLSSIEDMIRVRADIKSLNFTVEYHGLLPHFVCGDGHHLRQVLINLLGNAVKYTDSGSVTLKITAIPEDTICFEVIDTGSGIAEKDLQNIFRAFYQTENGIAKGEGTGLGLTISHEFVRLMGGEITVKSTEGQGSDFQFSILLPEVATPVISPKFQGRILSLPKEEPTYRILIAEDDADNRLLLTRLLENVGFDVKSVENGKEAVQAFQEWLPDFIWMDMRMPVMDGYQATKQIRALPNGQAVKIAALTASAFKEDRDSILSTGCDDMLTKPLSEDDLFAVMGTLLEFEYVYAESKKSDEKAFLNLSCLTPELRKELLDAAEMLDVEAAQLVVQKIKADFPEQASLLENAIATFNFDLIQKTML